MNFVIFLNKKKPHALSLLSALVFFQTLSTAQSIVFDISRNQPLYLHDDGYAASSIMAKELDKKFYQLSVNQLPLDIFLKNNSPSILVLTPTIFQFHANEEVVAVREYVKKGGNLLIFAEHENFFRSSENSNRFLEGSGIRINYDKAEQTKFNHFAEQFRVRAANPFVEKDSVIFFLPATLELKDSTYSKAKTEDGKHLAAIAPFGSGKMAVITDFEIIWNMTRKTGFQFGKNNEFIIGMINSLYPDVWLTRMTGDNFLDPKKKNIWINSQCIESDLSKLINYSPLINELKKKGYGVMFWDLNYEFQNNMKPTEIDIYIGLCACESEVEMNAVLKFKRIFLVGYNKTDFWKNITDKFAYFQSGGYDTKHMEESLQNLWEYDAYRPVSWEDSLEIKLGGFISRKLSVEDSVFKSSVESYSGGPLFGSKPLYSIYKLSLNLVEPGYKFEPENHIQGITNGGVYYPAPIENNILLTTLNIPSNEEDIPIFIYSKNNVFSTAPALWRSDFPDKEFQKLAIRVLLNKLLQ